MIHCGSRGSGHQVCTDHVRTMGRSMRRYWIDVLDRQLACTPGRDYLGVMVAAANYARANRQLLSEAARRAFADAVGGGPGSGLRISHNTAEIESYEVDGAERRLCVHRKGSTRALPPGDPRLPEDLADAGQTVLVPGTVGTASYVMVGMSGNDTGRVWSRHRALRMVRGEHFRDPVGGGRHRGGRPSSWRGLAEEAPEAYKDVDAVAAATEADPTARPCAGRRGCSHRPTPRPARRCRTDGSCGRPRPVGRATRRSARRI
nr:RtcB family protein [Kitasatospora griseola]